MKRALMITVIGAGDAPQDVCAMAREVGREIAGRGAVLINGGRGGVMRAAAEGARSAGGHTIGILPGYDRASANEFIEFVIATGMGEARNAIIVASADAVIAMAGEGGTLAEIGFAKNSAARSSRSSHGPNWKIWSVPTPLARRLTSRLSWRCGTDHAGQS